MRTLVAAAMLTALLAGCAFPMGAVRERPKQAEPESERAKPKIEAPDFGDYTPPDFPAPTFVPKKPAPAFGYEEEEKDGPTYEYSYIHPYYFPYGYYRWPYCPPGSPWTPPSAPSGTYKQNVYGPWWANKIMGK